MGQKIGKTAILQNALPFLNRKSNSLSLSFFTHTKFTQNSNKYSAKEKYRVALGIIQ